MPREAHQLLRVPSCSQPLDGCQSVKIHAQDVGPAGEAERFDELAADGTPFLLHVLQREGRADQAEIKVKDQPPSSSKRSQSDGLASP